MISRRLANVLADPRPRALLFSSEGSGDCPSSTERLIRFGKERAAEGAGPVTLGMDLGYIKTILSHAAAVHGVFLSTESLDLARIALGRLGLVGKGHARDRRPTRDELNQLIASFEANVRQQIPLGRIIQFAVATAMRQERYVASNRWISTPKAGCSSSETARTHAAK